MRFLLPLAMSLAVAAMPARAMSPEEAYAAIPHARTTFETRSSTLPAAQADSLKRLFALSDQGVILKVEGMRAQRARNAGELKRVLAGYDKLVENLEAQPFTGEVAPARDLIAKALRDHKRYMASRPEGGMQFARNELVSAPDVKRASASLVQAYNLLMQSFPREAERNKAAFFDYLCALDYL
jgi:hypothetical protein